MTSWWTAADQAETEALVHTLVDEFYEHREVCPRCAAGDLTCPVPASAIEVVLEWRELRALLSRAAYLRARQDLIEARGVSEPEDDA